MIIRIELLDGKYRVPIDVNEYEYERSIDAETTYEFINIVLTHKKGGK